MVQRQTVEVYSFTGECLRDLSNAVRQWNWRRCNLEESSHRRQPWPSSLRFLYFLSPVGCVIGARLQRDVTGFSEGEVAG